MTDKEFESLMLRSQGGDRLAYDRLLKALAPLLRASIRKMTARGRGDAASDAEEALQEALLAIHLKLHTWVPGSRVLPWAFAIAKYKAIDLLRSRGRAVVVELADADETAFAYSSDIDTRLDLTRAIAALPNYMRKSIETVKIEGLSIEEAALRTGMSPSAVKVGVHRGLAALSTLLKFGGRSSPDQRKNVP